MGIVGGSIEDWSGERIYDFNHAVERVQAGVEMVRSLGVPFTFTARADNLIRGVRDLDDTIRRLKAFEAAGADVLYAPGLRDLATMRTVVSEIGRPLNVVMSAGDPDLTADQIAAVGVKRISVGGALSRLALAAFMKGARDMKGGSFPGCATPCRPATSRRCSGPRMPRKVKAVPRAGRASAAQTAISAISCARPMSRSGPPWTRCLPSWT